MPDNAADDLRTRLVAMREALIEGLAEQHHLDAGHLALLGTVGVALIALNYDPACGTPAPRSIGLLDERDCQII